MSIKITNPGAMTTVQDLGRQGYLKYGFCASGAMDSDAARTANLLVGNAETQAVLEMTMTGITAIFNRDAVIALTGGDFTPLINNRPIPRYAAVAVQAGQILRCPKAVTGARCYLAVGGGFDLPQVMGSQSTNLKAGVGGFQGRKLERGDLIPFRAADGATEGLEQRRITPPDIKPEITLRAILGPQSAQFTEAAFNAFFHQPYRVTAKADRMGIRLEGAKLSCRTAYDILSDATVPGSIQVPASGQPIVLMQDCQTTGGYAKIAAVITADLARLAQVRPGGLVRFRQVGMEEAQNAYREREASFQKLRQYLLPMVT